MKKFLALVMAMVMALSLMVTANAATSNVVYTDSASVTPEFAEAVDVLSGMGVFKGDEDGFRPGSTITRAEVAAIVYRLATGDVNDVRSGLYKTYAPFTDVAETDWFAGYVGYLWNAGYIKGTTATTYNPYDNVTGYEALAMILRAVGYDKNHEFEGGNWIVNVASYATQLGILRDVKTTHFADTLHLGARRDVVASLLFNTAAYVPEVTYTALAGYNQFKNITSEEYNDTLGERLFGLTSDRGIVVGNQATGEKYTKIGFSYYGNREMKVLDGKDTICQFANKPSTQAYIYKTANGDNSSTNVTLSFIWDTNLKLFGHQVKVWYDNRTTNNTYESWNFVRYDNDGNRIGSAGDQFDNVLTTYAMYDEATKTAVVKVLDDDDNLGDVSIANDDDDLYKAATKKGVDFDIDAGDDGTYFNYAFAPTSWADYGVDGEDTHGDFESPIMQNNGYNNDEQAGDIGAENGQVAPYYLLISNDTDHENSLDMVISLDLTVTQISQQNDVWDPETIGLNVGTGDRDNVYFGGNSPAREWLAIAGATPYGTRVNIAQKNLVQNSAKTLGDQVVAIEITGTTDIHKGKNDPSVPAQDGNAKAVITPKAETSNYYYQTVKLTRQVSGDVVRVDTDTHEVWFADGTKLERSWLADTVASNRLLDLGSTAETNVEENVKRTIEVDDFGTYTFTLDDEGKYIFWSTEKAASRFVYGTYLDYTTPVASSTFTYPLVYVGLDGKQGQENVTKITNSTEPAPIETGHKLDTPTYEASELPKRDKIGGNTGAQVFDGRYIGYTINDKGELKAVLSADNATNTVKQGTDAFFGRDPVGDDEGSIVIENDDVKIGAVMAGRSDGSTSDALYLTENTQFYLVSGAGTDNQKVAAYKGLAELMKGNSKVIIHGEKTVQEMIDENIRKADDVWPLDHDTINPYNYEMIYWTQSAFHYAQDYATTAYQADVVILPAEAVEFVGSVSSALRFIGKSNSTMEDSANNATRFTMYDVNGNEEQVWVRGLTDNTRASYANYADAIIDLGNEFGTAASVLPNKAMRGNFFVNIVATDDKAKDGGTIYELVEVTGESSKLVGWFLDEITIVDDGDSANTARLANVNDDVNDDANYVYIATTYSNQLATIGADRSNIWNVAGAKVINLDTKCWPGVTDLTTLNYASSLEQNNDADVGDEVYSSRLQVSCFLSKDNSKQASVIFVNNETH